jgi:hypothetical protein
MIHVVGLDSDRTVVHFIAHARNFGVEITFINLRQIVDNGDWHIVIPDDGCSRLSISGKTIPLDPGGSYYLRPIDLSSVQDDPGKAVKWRGLVAALNYWLEHIPGTVVNRPGIHSDNFCKPLHEATLGSFDFNVPLSFTSSDARRLRAFASAAPTIVKPVSGVLATSRLVTEDEFEHFDRRQGPVHLQRYIKGGDVRAHVVGEEVYAERIDASGIDYRKEHASARYSQCELPGELSRKVIATTKAFGLTFMGWDFKVDSCGAYWCLEANPMPGYNFYDQRAGMRITKALIAVLGS